jgi:hypothetical protein
MFVAERIATMTIHASPPVRLPHFAKRAGCAAKHPPGFLVPLLGTLPAARSGRSESPVPSES